MDNIKLKKLKNRFFGVLWVFVVSLLFPPQGRSQYQPERIGHNIALSFLAGSSYAFAETWAFKHSSSVFSGASPQGFWGKESWKRKYRDYDGGDRRPAFPGSKSVLIGLTDGYHLNRAITRFSLNISTVTYRAPQKDIYRLYDLLIMQAAYAIGFTITEAMITN